jgi:hypothetical protein
MDAVFSCHTWASTLECPHACSINSVAREEKYLREKGKTRTLSPRFSTFPTEIRKKAQMSHFTIVF